MKYRIKEVITGGNTIFIPQYREFFFWRTWSRYVGYDFWIDVSFKTFEEAQYFITEKSKKIITDVVYHNVEV